MVAIFLAKKKGQTRHFRPECWSAKRCKLLKRTGFARGHDRRALKQILQIVIAVAGSVREWSWFFTRRAAVTTA